VRRLTTGCWHANHAVRVIDRRGGTHRLVLRRWARPGWEADDPDFTPEREVAVLELLAGSAVPAPRLVAADPDGATCDSPALLLTRLPGRPPGLPADMEAFLEQLAGSLAAIHALRADATDGIPAYRRYFEPSRLRPPAWALRPALWERAIEVAGTPAPPGPCTFIHRDYHPENTLWSRGRLTGVVDWTSGSFGPVAVDLGAMRWNLAVDYGVDAAEEFLRRYRSLTSIGGDDQPYWDIVTLLDLAGDEWEPGEWSRFESLRFERHLEGALERLGGTRRPP
jgi:aminoglycoside phosphotransferase (APT) family kinase protein